MEKEAIVSDPQVLGSDLWGQSQPARPVPYLCIPAEAGAGAGPTLPKSTLGPLGLPGQGRVGHMNPQTTALKFAVEKCVSFPV